MVGRVKYKNSFVDIVRGYLNKISGTVILRKDMDSLGSSRQISRAFKCLVESGELVKLGYGIYAKAETSEYLNRPVIKSGFTEACIEALNRLGVKWEPSQAIKDYNAGKSQQVPARFEVRLKSRFRRKIEYGSRYLRLEGMIYAK
jgi:hypothetical protein